MALTINSITVPTQTLANQPYSIDVSVTAGSDDVEDGSAFRLYVFANDVLVASQTGHLQDPPWLTADFVFHFTPTAGDAPAIYSIEAFLIEGPRGLDPEDDPSFAEAANDVAVVSA